MSRFGIDYGTTNTVVVSSDRGRYPVVPHTAHTAVGTVTRDSFPSLVAFDRGEGRYLYGFDAERCLSHPDAAERYEAIRSLKRGLRDYAESAGGHDAANVLAGFMASVAESIRRSGLFPADDVLEAVVTWPANANGAQRYVTRRALREAGFVVLDTLNEPSAAAIEYVDRLARGNRAAARRQALSVAVFDLGGGTFDVSIVRADGSDMTVVTTTGIEHLGGDDFDELLARLFAREMGRDLAAMDAYRRSLLVAESRRSKESIGSGMTHSLTLAPLDIGLKGPPCAVPVGDYFAELRPILAAAVTKLWEAVHSHVARQAGIDGANLDAIYLVGGSSLLPLVPAMVAERFPGVRIVMSDKPFTATAMGAAIHSTDTIRLQDVLARTFGVIRLAERGTREFFAPIFPAGTSLPQKGEPPLVHTVEYTPHHNIGRLRYLECGAMDGQGLPAAGVRYWSDALFPYDPALPISASLAETPVANRTDLLHSRIRESYECDADGVITARIVRLCDGQSRVYEVFRP